MLVYDSTDSSRIAHKQSILLTLVSAEYKYVLLLNLAKATYFQKLQAFRVYCIEYWVFYTPQNVFTKNYG